MQTSLKLLVERSLKNLFADKEQGTDTVTAFLPKDMPLVGLTVHQMIGCTLPEYLQVISKMRRSEENYYDRDPDWNMLHTTGLPV